MRHPGIVLARPEDSGYAIPRFGIALYTGTWYRINVVFADRGTEDLYNGVNSGASRRIVPAALRQRALDKLTLLASAAALVDLRVPPGNRLEGLKGNRAGQYSIRINDQYRICFSWTDAGAIDVEIVDYH
jgi:proteic killer suppression protein